jgi:hypothetical protein
MNRSTTATRNDADDAGRQIRTTDNYIWTSPCPACRATVSYDCCVPPNVFGPQPCNDQNVTVETTYNADGQVLTLTAKNPVTGGQTTRYQ